MKTVYYKMYKGKKGIDGASCIITEEEIEKKMENEKIINLARGQEEQHGVCYSPNEDYFFAIHINEIKSFHSICGIYKTIEGMSNLIKLHNSFNDNPLAYKKGLKSIKSYHLKPTNK